MRKDKITKRHGSRRLAKSKKRPKNSENLTKSKKSKRIRKCRAGKLGPSGKHNAEEKQVYELKNDISPHELTKPSRM